MAHFSTSSTNILQFLYLHTSLAEFLLFTNSDQSSQGKFTAVSFLQGVVLLVLFWTPAGCFDGASARQNKTQHCRSGAQKGCTDLFQEGASGLLADSSADHCSQAPHGKRHVPPTPCQQERNQCRFLNAMVRIKDYWRNRAHSWLEKRLWTKNRLRDGKETAGLSSQFWRQRRVSGDVSQESVLRLLLASIFLRDGSEQWNSHVFVRCWGLFLYVEGKEFQQELNRQKGGRWASVSM